MKSLPVIYNPHGQVGTVTLQEETVKQLEKLMEIKLEDFDAEPFVLSFKFQVDTMTGKFSFVAMNIINTN